MYKRQPLDAFGVSISAPSASQVSDPPPHTNSWLRLWIWPITNFGVAPPMSLHPLLGANSWQTARYCVGNCAISPRLQLFYDAVRLLGYYTHILFAVIIHLSLFLAAKGQTLLLRFVAICCTACCTTFSVQQTVQQAGRVHLCRVADNTV